MLSSVSKYRENVAGTIYIKQKEYINTNKLIYTDSYVGPYLIHVLLKSDVNADK